MGAVLLAFAWSLAEIPVESLESVDQLIDSGQYADAEANARELLARTEAESGEMSLEVGAVLDRLVEALWRGGRLGEETVEFAERAIAIHTSALGPEHPDVAVSLNHLGSVFLLVGKYDQANEMYERSLEIRKKALGPDHFEVATSLNNLAQVQYVLDDYAGARVRLERALAIREKHFGLDHPRVGVVLTSLGRLLERQGDAEGAANYLLRAVSVLEAAHGSAHVQVLNAKSALASIMIDQGNSAAAIPLLESLLEAQIESIGMEHPQTLKTMSTLGVALGKVGDTLRAKQTYGRLLEIRRRAFPDHPFNASAMINYGVYLFRGGLLDETRELFQEALRLRERWNGEDHLTVASALVHLAELNLAEGRIAEALDAALRSESIARVQFQQIAASLSESEALHFELIRASGLDVTIAVLAASENHPDDMRVRVWDSLIRSRAMVLDEIAARRRNLTPGADADLDSRIEELTTARNDLARLLVSGTGTDREQFLEDLHAARQRRARAERALAEKSSELRRKQVRQRIGLSDVAAALPEDSALVAYTRYHRRKYEVTSPPYSRHVSIAHYLALILEGAEARPRVVDLGPSETIDEKILAWRAQVGSKPPLVPLAARQAEARYREAGKQLRRLIWDPVAAHLGRSRQVIVVPEGSVHLVSFSTLPIGEGDFLAETGPLIHYLSAERDLVRTRGSEKGGEGLLALGGPNFGTHRTVASSETEGCDGLSGLEFAPLHAARAEVEHIAALWQEAMKDAPSEGTRVLTGDEATEAALRRLAPGRQVLHLATHGFFAQNRCGPVPQTELGSTDLNRDFGEETARRILNDPFLLSGLALAGANSRDATEADQDGILTAEEVATLDLSGVEWVVLSACETGLGEVQVGEGVLGLRRAFETSGAGTLIMSLWAVEDQATQDWMKRLYRQRLDGRTTVEAVQAATVESLLAAREAGKTTHPFYWGAFAAFGDWR